MRVFAMFLLTCLVPWSMAQEIPMFVGTYTHMGSQGIYLYMFDQEKGEAMMYSVTNSEHPSFLARSADGNVLYAVNETGDSTAAVSSFSFDGDALSYINALPTDGASPCHVAVSEHHPIAIVSNYGGGSLSVYRLAQNGVLAEKIQHIQQKGSSVNKERQNASHVHSAFFSPDGTQVFVQNLGTDKITIYHIEKENDLYRLVEEDQLSTPAGGGPRHLVFDGEGENMYVLLELTAEIAHFKKDNVQWELVDTVSINDEGYTGVNGAAEIKRSSDGRFIYASNRGDANTIALFAIDESGKLSRKDVYPTGGEAPRNFNISPDGRFLLVANQGTNNITVFERNRETGKLKDTGKPIEVSTPVCIVF